MRSGHCNLETKSGKIFFKKKHYVTMLTFDCGQGDSHF